MKRNVNERAKDVYIRRVEAKFVYYVVKINSIQWLNSQSQSHAMEWPKSVQSFFTKYTQRRFLINHLK